MSTTTLDPDTLPDLGELVDLDVDLSQEVPCAMEACTRAAALLVRFHHACGLRVGPRPTCARCVDALRRTGRALCPHCQAMATFAEFVTVRPLG